MDALEETVQEKHDKMREQAKLLREKREKERQQLVAEKREQQFRYRRKNILEFAWIKYQEAIEQEGDDNKLRKERWMWLKL